MTVHYAICTVKPWNAEVLRHRAPKLPGTWHMIDDPKRLSADALKRFSPRYLFFPHWSWRVPTDVIAQYECVCFHMTDLPYGRGGSPLQNLIVRGHKTTMLTALRMVEEFDAGPVYLKRPLSLEGRAEDIFARAADMIYELIAEIIANEPVPIPQNGEPVVFRRRTPEESRLPQQAGATALYDFIRMLDAPTYPKAFLEWGQLRLELDRATLVNSDMVEARVTILPREGR
jgi:methionyl-tRNA formyltransferase